jgi:hypothetical protein
MRLFSCVCNTACRTVFRPIPSSMHSCLHYAAELSQISPHRALVSALGRTRLASSERGRGLTGSIIYIYIYMSTFLYKSIYLSIYLLISVYIPINLYN